jgi:hypothetical protein
MISIVKQSIAEIVKSAPPLTFLSFPSHQDDEKIDRINLNSETVICLGRTQLSVDSSANTFSQALREYNQEYHCIQFEKEGEKYPVFR